MEVRIRHCHNHPLKASHVLQFRKPTAATKEAFLDYFKRGHTPSTALRTHMFQIQTEHGDDFYKKHADGAEFPKLQWCYYQYYKCFKTTYGENYGPKMIEKLGEMINDFNEANGKCAELYHHGNDVVVALCTPLMKRVHELLRSSSEVVFMDFSGGMDRFDTRIGFLITPSLAGGMPLGIIMCSSETQDLVTKGLEMLQALYPKEVAFYGRNEAGPLVFLTDDAKNERNSLRYLYPFAVLLLCLFHTLQAFLRYISKAESNVKKNDRPVIYDAFKKLVYSNSPTEFEENFVDLMSNEVTKSNEKILNDVVKDLYPRGREWALCYRKELLLRGNNTTNYVESNIRQVKDIVFERLKAFNLVQTFDFLTTKLDAYYKSRISNLLNDRVQLTKKSRHMAPNSKLLESLSAQQVSDKLFKVSNNKTKNLYTVDMDIDLCSCPVGTTGAPCKHQFYVAKEFDITTTQFLTTLGIEEKMMYHKLMTGHNDVSSDWYKTLFDGPESAVLSHDVSDVAQEITDQVSSLPDAQPTSEPLTPHADNNNHHDEVETWDTMRRAMCDGLSLKLRARPDVFLPGLKALITTYEKMSETSDNTLATALFSMKNLLRTSKQIKVQPTAKSRRVPHMGGRECRQTGRPLPNAARVPEHGYGKIKQQGGGPMRPVPATKKNHCASFFGW